MAVDWTKIFWPASFNGIPFWVDRDRESGGRRLAVHEFPGRDDPFVEDLGASAVRFEVTAYLVGDSSADDSTSLVSALTGSAGPGTLVLPLQGSQQAYLQTYDRSREKDKMGLIAFSLRFVLSGAASAVASAAYASQLAYDALAALGTAMAAVPAAMQIVNAPGWVADAAITALQDVPSGLEAIRAQGSVSASENLAITQNIADFYSAIPGLVSQTSGVDSSVASTGAGLAINLADALPAAFAAAAFGAAYDALPASTAPVATATPSVQMEQANAASAAQLARLTMLSGYVESVLGMTFASRTDGVATRSALVSRIANELAQTMGGSNADLYVALENLRSATVAYLTKLIADLRPILSVGAPRSLPSIWWAWRLYQDPTQAPEIVARNKVRHPSFCPQTLEVLAPTSTAASPA